MTKLRVQGGKLCVVAGQIEQCCETPGGCFAYLSECGCTDPVGQIAVPFADVFEPDQRLWPVYYQRATPTQPDRAWVLVRVSKTLDPGVPFSPFFGYNEGREACETISCPAIGFELIFDWQRGCPDQRICMCARYGFAEVDYTYTFTERLRERGRQPWCPDIEITRTTTVRVQAWSVFDVQTRIATGSHRQRIEATGQGLTDLGNNCAGVEDLEPYSSDITEDGYRGGTLIGGEQVYFDPGFASSPPILLSTPPRRPGQARYEWTRLSSFELDHCSNPLFQTLPCANNWTVDRTVPINNDDCLVNRTGFTRHRISYSATPNRFVVSHDYELQSYDDEGYGFTRIVSERKRHGLRFSNSMFVDPGIGFVIEDGCEPPDEVVRLGFACDGTGDTWPYNLTEAEANNAQSFLAGQPERAYAVTPAVSFEPSRPVNQWSTEPCQPIGTDRFRLATRCSNGRRPGNYPETIRCPIETPVGTSLYIFASGGGGLTCVIRYVATDQTTDDESLQIGTPTTRTACSGQDLCFDPDGGTGDQPVDLSELCFICTGPAQPPVCSVPAVQAYLQSNCGRRLPGSLTQTSTPRAKPCLPCQQRRDAGLEAALAAQRAASGCRGCGDAGGQTLI